MCGGDGKTNAGSHREIQRGSSDGADHAKHEHRRIVLEQTRVDYFGTDGIGNAGADADRTGKFHDRGQDHGLEVGDGLGTDRGGPRVGDIVGT